MSRALPLYVKGITHAGFLDGGRSLTPGGGTDATDVAGSVSASRPRLRLPEHALMLAVLEDAVHTLHRHAHSRQPDAVTRCDEVRAWLRSPDRRWLFSFVHICEQLDLDPDTLRAGILGYACRVAGRPARGCAASQAS